LRHSSADDMALGHTDRRLIGSHPKARIAVVAKRKIPLIAGNLTLVVQPSATTYRLTITETNPSSHSIQNFLHISLRLIHICFLFPIKMESSQKKSMKTKQTIDFPHFFKYATQEETLKMKTLII